MPMTMMQILKNIAKYGGERPYLANLVKVTAFKAGRVRSKPNVKIRFIAKTWSIEGTGKRRHLGKYVTYIEYLNDKHVKVSCSCGDFWARWEYALWRKGAADITYSNGEPPDKSNPMYRPAACIAKGSYVLTDTGSKLIENIAVGDKVLTLDGYHSVSDAGLTRRNTDTLCIYTARLDLEVTPDHLVLCIRKGSAIPEWIEADSLSVGDYLVEVTPSVTYSLLPEYETAGLFMAEHDEVHGTPIDLNEKPYVTALFKKTIKTARTVTQQGRLDLPQEKVAVLSRMVGFDVTAKHVPEVLFSNMSALASFMRGVWVADGWVAESARYATLATIIPGLAKDYVRALRTLGISSNITKNYRNADSDYVQYLVRVTDARSCARLNALLKNSPKDAASVSLLPANSDKRVLPFSINAIRKKLLQRALKQSYTVFAAPKPHDVLVPVSSRTSTRGEAMSLLGNAVTRVTFAGATKPSYAATPEALDLAMYILDIKYSRVLKANQHVTCTRSVLLKALEHSGKVPQAVVDFYKTWSRPCLKYHEITYITQSRADVYDLTVPEVGHFTANGLVVHNCKHLIKLTDVAFREGYLNPDFTLKT